jgi:hypothetical protein
LASATGADNSQNLNFSAYNKAWLGDGTLAADEWSYRNSTPLNDNMAAFQGTNERGFICFRDNDEFIITHTINQPQSVKISAFELSFSGERAKGTRNCVRSRYLASYGGLTMPNWGCSNFLIPGSSGDVDTYSACCLWTIQGSSCTDYSSAVNPYRCDQVQVIEGVKTNRPNDQLNSVCAANTYGTRNGSTSTVQSKSLKDSDALPYTVFTGGTLTNSDPTRPPDIPVPFNYGPGYYTTISGEVTQACPAYFEGNGSFAWKCQEVNEHESGKDIYCCGNSGFKKRNASLLGNNIKIGGFKCTTQDVENNVCYNISNSENPVRV